MQRDVPNDLQRIADALELISQCMLKQIGEIRDDILPVRVAASTGTCPECDSTMISAHGTHPHNIYICKDCSFAWVNEQNLQ